jgi:CrcB protein
MVKNLLFVFLGGGMGAVLRFLIGKFSTQIFETNFPVGTIVANLLACSLVGFLVYQFNLKLDASQKTLYLFLVVGLCGGLSTFSTFSIETFELIKQGNVAFAILNVIISITAGLGSLFMLFKQN